VAFKIGQKGASAQNTFGYQRAEVLAALINGAILVGPRFSSFMKRLSGFKIHSQ